MVEERSAAGPRPVAPEPQRFTTLPHPSLGYGTATDSERRAHAQDLQEMERARTAREREAVKAAQTSARERLKRLANQAQDVRNEVANAIERGIEAKEAQRRAAQKAEVARELRETSDLFERLEAVELALAEGIREAQAK